MIIVLNMMIMMTIVTRIIIDIIIIVIIMIIVIWNLLLFQKMRKEMSGQERDNIYIFLRTLSIKQHEESNFIHFFFFFTFHQLSNKLNNSCVEIPSRALSGELV